MSTTLRLRPASRIGGLLAVTLCLAASAALAQSTVVRVATSQGNVDMQLLDTETPKTVANFLAYVRSNAWAGVFIHRSIPSFVFQTGGYRWPAAATSPTKITSLGTVVNEFSPSRSNVRGTVAMAKLGGNPDSATSEWFVNLADNASNLDNQNGGFTVFARVSTDGMVTADKIAALPRVNCGGTFSELPLTSLPPGLICSTFGPNVVTMSSVTEFPAQAGKTDSDRIFDHLEKAYPEYVPAEGKQSGTALGYVYRYYPKTNSYVGTKDNQVWYLVPAISPDIQRLGTLTDWLVTAATSGN